MTNIYLQASPTGVYVRTALPLIGVMLISGSSSLLDIYFLGQYVGDLALQAVMMSAPVNMLLLAVAALVPSGMSSELARALGGNRQAEAREVFAQAVTLSAVFVLMIIGLYLLVGEYLLGLISQQSPTLMQMSAQYLEVRIFGLPVTFLLALHENFLRCAGRIKVSTSLMLGDALLEIIFKYVLIVHGNFGIVGSAVGTLAAHAVLLVILAGYLRHGYDLAMKTIWSWSNKRSYWWEMLSLGVPASAMSLGATLLSMAVFYNLQKWDTANYPILVTAFGIVSRINVFMRLPMMGLSAASKTILGHQFGAQQWQRLNQCLKIGLAASIVYCLTIEGALFVGKSLVGGWFTDNEQVRLAVSHMTAIIMFLFVLVGPLLIMRGFFQAIGDAKRFATLSLLSLFCCRIPFVFILPFFFGVDGIWLSIPFSEVFSFVLTIAVVYRHMNSDAYVAKRVSSQAVHE